MNDMDDFGETDMKNFIIYCEINDKIENNVIQWK